MARTKQHRTYLPYTFPAIADPEGMEGCVNPDPGCKEQTVPRLLRDRLRPVGLEPRSRDR